MCILSNNNQYHISNIIGLNFNSNDNINYLNPYIIHGNLSHIKEKYSIENGMLTPTLKLKRYKIINKYKMNFENLYS